jgi:hypothetical protein
MDPELLTALKRRCDCLEKDDPLRVVETRFHAEQHDVESEGWKRLLDLVEAAAADGRSEFVPARDLGKKLWSQVVTLPRTIAKLNSVRRLLVPGSWLVRIPPEIGEMESLEEFVPYTSDRLHWFPYEITRCQRLERSCVSTRCLYGNYNHRPAFPQLQSRASTSGLDLERLLPEVWGVDAATSCSACNQTLAESGLYQVWLSLNVATNALPLLVNACSETCIQRLPRGPANCIRTPHMGRPHVQQPPAGYPF